MVIQFWPQVITTGDRSYHYSCSSSRSSSEELLSDNELIPQSQLDNNKDKEEKKHLLTVQPLLTTAHDTGPQQEVPPLLSSTPCRPLSWPGSRLSSAPSRTAGYPEGTYMGKVRHKDGSLMTVVFEVNSLYAIFILDIMGYNLLSCFQLKQIVLRNDQHLYCMWITREVDCLVRDNSMASPADPSNKNQQVHTYTCTCMYFTAQKGEGRVSGRVSSHLVIPTSVFLNFILCFDFSVFFGGGV